MDQVEIYRRYALHNIETGELLYITTATDAEILSANSGLRKYQQHMRFFIEGDFSNPNLHEQ